MFASATKASAVVNDVAMTTRRVLLLRWVRGCGWATVFDT
jgi:hypothetical protein